MPWIATNGSMTLGPYDNGKFTFPINTGNTPVNWEVTYSDGKCTGSTIYTVLSGNGDIVDNGYAQCGTHKGEDILVTLSDAISLEDAKKAIKFVSSTPSGINSMQIARKNTSLQTTNEFYIKFENWPVNENEDTDENVQDITVTLSIYGTNKVVHVKNRGAFKVVLAKENKQWDKTNTDGALYFSAYTEYICNNDIKTIIDKNKLCLGDITGPFGIPSDPGIMKSIDKDLEYTMPIFFKSGECQAEPGRPCTGTATVYLCDDETKNLTFNLIYSATTRIVHFINFFKPQDGQGGTLTPNVYLCVVDANGNIPTGTDISSATGYGGGFEYNFGKGNTISASELLSMGINVPSDYSPKSSVNVGAFWYPPNQSQTVTPTSSYGNYTFSLSTNGGNRQDIYLACNGKKYIDAAGKETHYQNLCDYS